MLVLFPAAEKFLSAKAAAAVEAAAAAASVLAASAAAVVSAAGAVGMALVSTTSGVAVAFVLAGASAAEFALTFGLKFSNSFCLSRIEEEFELDSTGFDTTRRVDGAA